MKKVLIITYYWPPASGPGVQRFLKMSRYLPDYGWKPYILTVKNGTYPSYDESLLDDVPAQTRVIRTKTFEPYKVLNALTGKKKNSFSVGLIGFDARKSLFKRFSLYLRANFFIPDARRGWKPYAYKAARQIIQKEQIDVVITTGPPHSTHLTGLKLKKNAGIPWLADLRDPWVNVYYNKFFPRSKRTQHKDQALETKIVSTADMVTVVSDGLKAEFENRARDILTVFNGFDASDMPKHTVSDPVEKFTLSYIGNFKPNQNVEALWTALASLKNERQDFAEDFQLQLTGNIDPNVLESLKNVGLDKNLKIQSFIPHQQATQMMARSSLLLFIVPQSDNNDLIITGKLFEYVATNVPVLSVGPLEGDASKILQTVGRDPMHSYKDVTGFKEQLIRYYEHWKKSGKVAYRHSKTDISAFTRQHQTKKLSEALNKLSNE